MIVYADREEPVPTLEGVSEPLERLIKQGQREAAFADGTKLAKIPEGYAYYALYPEQYKLAAENFAAECRPDRCVVIGIRSIGTSLSHVVADALPCPVRRLTVRPVGHPFDRKASLPDLRSNRRDWFLVVDEGPGLSGSSFASVADALRTAGVPDERIVFFPSHEPDPEGFICERARQAWPRHRKFVVPFEKLNVVPAGAIDFSGGKWRSGQNYPDVVPHLERRKYLHEGQLWKFEGLAHLGRRRLHRAQRLLPFIPEPIRFENGFLLSKWVEGEPAREASTELMGTVRRYLTHLEHEFGTDRPVRYAELREMIHVNTGIETPERSAEIEDLRVIEGDGRMFLHDWICTAQGYLKTDALHHHDDHLFPGCQPIDWDLAGAEIEMNIKLERRPNPFFTLAYLAFRIGFTTMFGQHRLLQRYTAALEEVSTLLPSSSKA